MTRKNLSSCVALSLLLCAACADSSGGSAASQDAASTTDATDTVDSANADVAELDGDAGTPDASTNDDTTPAGPPYNPLTQEGCAQGEKCTYDSFDNIHCGEVGTKPIGAVCTGTGDCAEGICINLNGTESYCYAFCKIDAHCAFGTPCLDLQDAAFKVCEIDGIYEFCTLLSDDCEAGKGCYFAGDDAPICLPAGEGDTKDSCVGPSDCAPTHTCINTVCLPLCEIGSTQPCGDNFTPCVPHYSPHGVGYCDV